MASYNSAWLLTQLDPFWGNRRSKLSIV